MACPGSVYAWSIFIEPLQNEYGYLVSQTQLVFGFIIAFFVLIMILAGRLEKRYGPRLTAATGAVIFTIGYLVAAASGGNLSVLILGMGVLSGIGMGFGYITVLATVVKWFPNNKGLAMGFSVAGFGGGAIILSQIVSVMLQNGMPVDGYLPDNRLGLRGRLPH